MTRIHVIISKVSNRSENFIISWNAAGFKGKCTESSRKVYKGSVKVKFIYFKYLTGWPYVPLGKCIISFKVE